MNPSRLLVVASLTVLGCATKPAPGTQPVVAASGSSSAAEGAPAAMSAASGSARASANPSVAVATAPSAASASCAPWGGRGFTVKTDSFAGIASFNSAFEYDDATGALKVHDSDPYANGSGGKARVIDKTVTLSDADREALAHDLMALCADAKERAARCAPGGCNRVVITAKGGASESLENGEIPTKVILRLRGLVPELRKR